MRPFGLLSIAALALAAQDTSTITVTGKKGEETVAIRNVTYEVSGGLVLRRTEVSKEVLNEKGIDATTTVEAWPVGADRKAKPKYTIASQGIDGRPVDGQYYQIQRGIEDTLWWSVFDLATGKPLFSTFVRVFRVPETGDLAGYDVPEDGDPRLQRNPRLLGVVAMAAPGGPVKRIEVHCKDAKRAVILRSFADVRPELKPAGKDALSLTIHDALPDVTVRIPLAAAGPVEACDNLSR